MTNDNILSKTISYLRFPLTVGVVLIHFNMGKGLSVHGIEYGLNNPEWFFYLTKLCSEILPSIAVPLFFLISGFLFFYHTDFDRQAYFKKLRSRARTLLLPYILWNVISIVWQGVRVIPGLSKIFPNAHEIQIDWSASALLNVFWNNKADILVHPATDVIDPNMYPACVPMWYVRELILMVLLAPAIYYLIKKSGQHFVLVLGLAWYVTQPLYPGYPHQVLAAAFFFSWGAWFSIRKADFVATFRKYSIVPLLYIPIVIADILTREEAYNHYIHAAGIVMGVMTAVALTSRLLGKGKIQVNGFLANASFFVFALHTLFLTDVGKAIFKLMHQPESVAFWLPFYFLVPAVDIAVCLLLYKGLKKYFPRMAGVLTGGR